MNFNHENGEILAFSRNFPTLDYHKIRTRTNVENPKGKSLDLHLM